MDNITYYEIPPVQTKIKSWQQVERDNIASSVAVKHDSGKPPMSLLSTKALVEVAKVLDFGCQKYSEHNWRKGFKWSRLLDAAQRHVTSFIDGESKDPETGLSHIAHAMCMLMFLLEHEQTHPELDDRYKNDTN